MKGVIEKVRKAFKGAEVASDFDTPKDNVTDAIDEYRTTLFEGALVSLGFPQPRFERHGVERSIVGLVEYLRLKSSGRPSNFLPSEMVPDNIIPPVHWFPRLALLRWVADECRGDEEVKINNTYRPTSFNEAVGGAKDSAHIHCCAIDMQFPSRKAWLYAMRKLHALYRSPVNFGIGLGVGGRTIHVDFFSPTWTRKGCRPRWWTYPTAPPEYIGPLSDKGVE